MEETSSIGDEVCETIRSFNRVVKSTAKAAEARAVTYVVASKVEVGCLLVQARDNLGLSKDTPLKDVAVTLDEVWKVLS